MTTAPLILASQSKARYHMLRAAGLNFHVQEPALDEEGMQHKMREALTPPDAMAQALAQAKALSVASRNPNHLVIGGDQVLFCNGRIYSKAPDPARARDALETLSGKVHYLLSAVCLVQKDKVLWSHTDRAKMTMRDLDKRTLDKYCTGAGDTLTRSVGAYELEGSGAWLFDRVEGDYFTILGMPLLPLLSVLREKGYGL